MPADPVSTITHLLGALAFAIVAVPLVRRARHGSDSALVVAVFAASAVALLSASTLYHLLPYGSGARFLARRLDHAAIFVLIAGTFTPVHTILFRGVLRWGILALIWGCAAGGIALKLAFFAQVPYWAHVVVYLAMGWLGVIGWGVLVRRRGFGFTVPVAVGAAAYTGGAASELAGWPELAAGAFGPHEVLHVGVLVGLGAFAWFVWRISGARQEPVWWREPVVGETVGVRSMV